MKTKKQFTNRILSLVLALVMVLGMMPMTKLTASAANISTTSTPIKEGHYIYFGSNGQKWRVLDASKTSMGSDGMFLFSENSLETASIGPTAQNYTTNGLEAWCTNYYNGTNFTAAEKTVMLATTVAQSTGTYDDQTGTNYALDGDYLFLLSAAEAANSAYFADDEARELDHSKYQSKIWFLRTDNNLGTKGQIFNVTGLGRITMAPITSHGGNGENWSYRPGFNLDTSKILFVTAATNGKSDGLTAVSTFGNEWKLTLKDGNSFDRHTLIGKTTVCAGESVTVRHLALSDISADYTNVTAAIFQGDTMVYYGSINSDPSATGSKLVLPSNLVPGNYTLKVYGEDWNGDKRTDIATGTPYSVNITIKNHTGGSATCIAKAICTDCGNEYGNYSDHSYQYTVSDSTIIETCRNGCDHRATATLTATDATYAGSPITTGAYVIYSDSWAGSQEHGEITYSNNLNVGDATAKVTVEGKVLTTTFKINAAKISGAAVTLNPTSGTYTGTAYNPSVSVTLDGFGTLVEGTDYTLSWNKTGFTNAESYTVTVTGKGNFKGTKNAVFSINPADIKSADVILDQNTFVYDGQPHKPTAIVTFNGAVLTEGVDYELYYISKDQIMTWENGEPVKLFGTGKENCDSINAGQYYAIVFGKGNFATSSRFAYAPYTIKQAKNNWVTEPWITDWTYGKSANAPVGEAKFGTVYVLYDGPANDGTTYNGDTPPTKAGSYVARFFVDETANYEPIAYSVPFTVKKANYNMIGAKWNYREPFQYNGKEHKVEVVGLPAGVTVKNYENNTAVAVGDYYAEVSFDYDADNYNAPVINKLGWTIYNDWTPSEYTVNGSGWMNEDFVISAKNGYKISLTNTANGTWEDALTYSAETNNGSVTFYLKNETSGTISLAKTVSYKLDKTEPTGRVEFVERTGWEEFINTITFGLFYKDEVTVKVTAEDNLSGVAKIEYVYSNEAKTLNEVKEIADWTEYNGEFGVSLQDAKKFVYFVRITDNAGNVTYLSTDGAEYDTTAPVLYGIENGGVYHGDKVFKAMDKNFLKIEVDGVDITDTTEGDDEFKIVADNAEHTVTVTDEAGNVTEFKITVYKKYMVTYSNGDGGSYEKEFKYGEVITIPTNEFFKDTFRKTGHAIKEWQGYTEGMTMPLKDLTFTAVYVPCEYTVTFEENGGEEINPITVTFGEKYGSLPSSVITGLSGGNKNWYLVDADGNVTDTNIKNLTIVSTARDHKLFIKRNVLAPSISVALTVPGGISDGYQYYIPGASTRVLTATVGNMNTDILEYTYQWYKDGTLIEGANSNVLTLDGNVSDSGTYKVEVTAKLKDGTNIVVNSNTATASKEQKVKILHATNTLSYDANGGEGGPQSSYTGGTSINVSKETPTKEHSNFIGWNTAPDGTGESYQAEDAYIFVNDNGNGGCVVTLYARWKLVEYTVTYVADGESVATEKVEHGKDAILTDVPHKDGYVGKWDSDGKNITEDTTISAVYTEVPVVNPDEVKPEDKTNLEDTKAKLEEMLKDDSYTDDDKKDIQDAIDDIDDALEVIGNVEAAIELIDKLPDTITKDNEAAIKAADDAYNALTDYEKSLVDEGAKKTLDDAKAALAELNKPADTTSPATDNTNNLWLWAALLFVSGGTVITLTVVDKKKRAVK